MPARSVSFVILNDIFFQRKTMDEAFARAEGTLFNSRGQAAALSRAAPGTVLRALGPLKEGGWCGVDGNGVCGIGSVWKKLESQLFVRSRRALRPIQPRIFGRVRASHP